MFIKTLAHSWCPINAHIPQTERSRKQRLAETIVREEWRTRESAYQNSVQCSINVFFVLEESGENSERKKRGWGEQEKRV